MKQNIQVLLIKSGLRKKNLHYRHGDRTGIPMSHGFRKFWVTEAIKSKLPHDERETLILHDIGLTGAYYRPTVDEMLDTYLIGVDNFTINPENRLKREVETLKEKQDKLDKMINRIQDLENKLSNINNKIQ